MLRADALTVGEVIANGGRCGAIGRGAREGARLLNADKGRDVGKVRARWRKADGGDDRPLCAEGVKNGLVTSPFPCKKIV